MRQLMSPTLCKCSRLARAAARGVLPRPCHQPHTNPMSREPLATNIRTSAGHGVHNCSATAEQCSLALRRTARAPVWHHRAPRPELLETPSDVLTCQPPVACCRFTAARFFAPRYMDFLKILAKTGYVFVTENWLRIRNQFSGSNKESLHTIA